ncbi:MAG: hypothetical protein VX583_13325 [Bdellovibrionota bacterium]
MAQQLNDSIKNLQKASAMNGQDINELMKKVSQLSMDAAHLKFTEELSINHFLLKNQKELSLSESEITLLKQALAQDFMLYLASIKSYMQTLNRLKSLGFAVDKDLEESQGRIQQLEQDQDQLLIAP